MKPRWRIIVLAVYLLEQKIVASTSVALERVTWNFKSGK